MINWDKKIARNDGKKCRVINRGLHNNNFPIAVAVENDCCQEIIVQYATNGECISGLNGHKIKNVPELHSLVVEDTVYLNLGRSFSSLDGARSGTTSRWPVLEVSFQKGEIIFTKLHDKFLP